MPQRAMDRERASATIALLALLDAGDAAALAAAGLIRGHRPGAFIAREGDPGDALHTVLHGSVRIAVTAPDGTKATLTVLGPGDSFGELSLLDGRPRSASAIALGVHTHARGDARRLRSLAGGAAGRGACRSRKRPWPPCWASAGRA